MAYIYIHDDVVKDKLSYAARGMLLCIVAKESMWLDLIDLGIPFHSKPKEFFAVLGELEEHGYVEKWDGAYRIAVANLGGMSK